MIWSIVRVVGLVVCVGVSIGDVLDLHGLTAETLRGVFRVSQRARRQDEQYAIEWQNKQSKTDEQA